MAGKEDLSNIIQSLSPIEREIIPFLNLKTAGDIARQQNIDPTKVKRALEFLSNKSLLTIKLIPQKTIVFGSNGFNYKKNGLPERKLLDLISKHKKISLENAKGLAGLNDQEFSISLGMLKRKLMINLEQDIIVLKANENEISKRFVEEDFLNSIPLDFSKLTPEQKFALDNLMRRKDIVKVEDFNEVSFELTDLGKTLMKNQDKIKKSADMIEALTPEILQSGKWKNKQFRKYDLQTKVPSINGGRKHFVNQSIEYAKKIWTDLGFKEMNGPMLDSSFWIFDSLFTPQDHPAREMQDTFFIKGMSMDLPDKKIVSKVREAHEKGIVGSKGWNYSWTEKEAQKAVLRTHTTGLSARTLATLKEKDIPAKYFAIGKVFRNETVDWSHAFEFYQTEGIVVDQNANLRHLLGYLKEFYKKMGIEKIRFRPSYFAYTEPSVEIEAFHPEKKIWFELGGAGIFRPEITAPLFGKPIPVLAWGQGFDRIIMDFYKIKDLREMYANDLKDLRTKRFWIK